MFNFKEEYTKEEVYKIKKILQENKLIEDMMFRTFVEYVRHRKIIYLAKKEKILLTFLETHEDSRMFKIDHIDNVEFFKAMSKLLKEI